MMSASANTIKKIRNNLLLERKEFAEKIGITTMALSNYEKGRLPRMIIIKRILDLAKENNVNITVEDFFKDEE